MGPPQAKNCLFSSFCKEGTIFLICLIKPDIARGNVWLCGTGPEEKLTFVVRLPVFKQMDL